MEKWKIAAILALLGALPVYGYFVDGAKNLNAPAGAPTGAPSGTPTPTPPSPPAYLQSWWGKKPPTFNFPQKLWINTDKPLKLEDLRGKVVLLEMWRAECSHCQEAIPVMEELYRMHEAEGLKVIGVHSSAAKGTIEYDWPALKKWIPEHHIEYPVVYDEERSLFNTFKAQKFPTIVIIDRQGIIRYAHEGMTAPLAVELKAALEQIMTGKEPTWPPSKESGEDAAVKYAPDAKP